MRSVGLALLLSAPTFAASAYNLSALRDATQSQFHDIAKDSLAAYHYKPLRPPSDGGLLGFGVSGYFSVSSIDNDQAWEDVFGQDSVKASGLAGISVFKDLPLGLSVGAVAAVLPDSSQQLVGVEASYALMDGGIVKPTVALRGSYSQILRIDDFDYASQSVELLVSKPFPLLTPYAGIGGVFAQFKPGSDLALDSENPSALKLLAGLRAGFGIMSLTLEAEKTGADTGLGLRVNVGI